MMKRSTVGGTGWNSSAKSSIKPVGEKRVCCAGKKIPELTDRVEIVPDSTQQQKGETRVGGQSLFRRTSGGARTTFKGRAPLQQHNSRGARGSEYGRHNLSDNVMQWAKTVS